MRILEDGQRAGRGTRLKEDSVRYFVTATTLCVVLAAPAAWAAVDAKAVFQQKCAACHTIGGGRTVGPDLAGVAAKRDPAWLVRFIQEPDKLIAEGDATAKALVAEFGMAMPATGVTNEEAAAIAAMLAGPVKPPAAAGTAAAPAVPAGPAGDGARGAKLFTGELAFEKRGAACISCHHAGGGALGGGTLARDLSGVHERLGPAGLKGALETLPFPVMKEIYADKALTPQEVADLGAFFAHAGNQPPTSAGDGGLKFGAAGVLGTLGLFTGMALFWPRRRKGVRESLVERK